MDKQPRNKSLSVRMVLLTAAAVVALYGCAYWSLVTPGLMIRKGRVIPGPIYTNHRSTQKALTVAFWPVHQVDRILRPELWQADIADGPMEMLRTPVQP